MSVGLMIKAEVEHDKNTHTVFLDELMEMEDSQSPFSHVGG